MSPDELNQLQTNSNAFQDAVGKPHKTHPPAFSSGFYNPNNVNWWLSADIRPEAIHLKINSLNADQLSKLVRWMCENLEVATTE